MMMLTLLTQDETMSENEEHLKELQYFQNVFYEDKVKFEGVGYKYKLLLLG